MSISVKDTLEYELITDHYYMKETARSRVPLVNHINEGLVILGRINASEASMRAFCLHPLVQDDKDLAVFERKLPLPNLNQRALFLAMEYRNVANRYLSHCETHPRCMRLGPLKDVRDMLIADKVQNRKDFMRYHHGVHCNSFRLYQYFEEWLECLGVSSEEYQRLIEGL